MHMASTSTPLARKKSLVSVLLLFLTAFIWGMGFVAQRSGMEYIGPFLFNGMRQVLGVLTLVVVLVLMQVWSKARGSSRKSGLVKADPAQKGSLSILGIQLGSKRTILVGGLICGLVLFVASNLQQIAMVTTAASKAGFITTLYIVLVPLIGIAFRHKTRWNTWLSVGIAVIGLYLLCISESFTIAPGDILLLGCSLFWAFHILFIARFVPGLGQRELMALCTIQFLVSALLSLVCSPFFDSYFVSVPLSMNAVFEVMPEIAYAGILSTGVAFTLQAIGQKNAPPTPAAIVMSFESVFALLGGAVLLSEVLSGREVWGCLLMFIAVILAQLTFKRKSSNPQRE